MSRRGIRVALLALAAALAPAVWASSHEEAAQPPSLFFVWTDHVPLAHAAEYETELKKVLAKLQETEEGKKLQFGTLAGPGGDYSVVIPLADMADFARKNQEFMAATEAIGGMEAWAATSAHVSKGSGHLWALRPDLSYTPADPRPEEATGSYRWYEWWYVRPGHEAAAEELAGRFAALYKAKGIDSGWRFYQAITGDDLPLYLVAFSAKDAADLHTNDARVDALLGEEGAKLFQEAASIARRLEHTSATVRPDLSLGM